MKKKYEPISVPVCLCGRQASVFNRIREGRGPYKVVRWHEAMDDDGLPIGFHAELKKLPLWLCECECGIVCGGGTKREAVRAFEREVHVDVVV